MKEERFEIRVYRKRELAQCYAPFLTTDSALKKLNGWIRRNPELYARLYHTGPEGRNDQFFSKRQVQLLVGYLGEP